MHILYCIEWLYQNKVNTLFKQATYEQVLLLIVFGQSYITVEN